MYIELRGVAHVAGGVDDAQARRIRQPRGLPIEHRLQLGDFDAAFRKFATILVRHGLQDQIELRELAFERGV